MIEVEEIANILTGLLKCRTNKNLLEDMKYILSSKYDFFDERSFETNKYKDLLFIKDRKDAQQTSCAIFDVLYKNIDLSQPSNSQSTHVSIDHEFESEIEKVNNAICDVINHSHINSDSIYGYIILVTDNLYDVTCTLNYLKSMCLVDCDDVLKSIDSSKGPYEKDTYHILIHRTHYEDNDNGYGGTSPKYTCYYRKVSLI